MMFNKYPAGKYTYNNFKRQGKLVLKGETPTFRDINIGFLMVICNHRESSHFNPEIMVSEKTNDVLRFLIEYGDLNLVKKFFEYKSCYFKCTSIVNKLMKISNRDIVNLCLDKLDINLNNFFETAIENSNVRLINNIYKYDNCIFDNLINRKFLMSKHLSIFNKLISLIDEELDNRMVVKLTDLNLMNRNLILMIFEDDFDNKNKYLQHVSKFDDLGLGNMLKNIVEKTNI